MPKVDSKKCCAGCGGYCDARSRSNFVVAPDGQRWHQACIKAHEERGGFKLDTWDAAIEVRPLRISIASGTEKQELAELAEELNKEYGITGLSFMQDVGILPAPYGVYVVISQPMLIGEERIHIFSAFCRGWLKAVRPVGARLV